jgi:hypothetical protein
LNHCLETVYIICRKSYKRIKSTDTRPKRPTNQTRNEPYGQNQTKASHNVTNEKKEYIWQRPELKQIGIGKQDRIEKETEVEQAKKKIHELREP